VGDKTYKVVSLISRCASIISMDIHIHGKPGRRKEKGRGGEVRGNSASRSFLKVGVYEQDRMHRLVISVVG